MPPITTVIRENYTRNITTPDPAIADGSLVNGSGNGFISWNWKYLLWSSRIFVAKPTNPKRKTTSLCKGQIPDLEA
jgi:hypothetical protein